MGLRIDLGNSSTGIGPNFKHQLNKKLSLDASLLFFEDMVGADAQIEQNISVKGARGLSVYIGLGPQVMFGEETTAVALIPITCISYIIPRSVLNLSLDWRPRFYLTCYPCTSRTIWCISSG